MSNSAKIQARLVVDADHYRFVAAEVPRARVSVWISTANLKTMLVEAPIGTRARARGRYVSFFETLGELAERGVDVCILHASPPGRFLARELAKASPKIRLRMCPRVHLKMIAVDGRLLYLGSANLTGAGLGAKGEKKRNFEMGIVTDDERMLDAAQARFDAIWRGRECGSCALRRVCPAPLDVAPVAKAKALPVIAARVTSGVRSRRACRSPASPR